MDPIVPLAPNAHGISYIAFRARWRGSLGCCGVCPGRIRGSPISCAAFGVLEAEGHEAWRLPAGFWGPETALGGAGLYPSQGHTAAGSFYHGVPAPQIFSTHLMWLGLVWPNPRIWDLQRLQDGIVGLEQVIFIQNPPNLQCKEGETYSGSVIPQGGPRDSPGAPFLLPTLPREWP